MIIRTLRTAQPINLKYCSDDVPKVGTYLSKKKLNLMLFKIKTLIKIVKSFFYNFNHVLAVLHVYTMS